MSNFEHDLFSSTHILNKIHTPPYAQHLYAALCNNELQHDSTSTRTHYTWRGAGGLVADLEARSGPSIDHIFNSDTANHIRWYCSGMFRNDDNHYVQEGHVTDEIRADLLTLGWSVFPLVISTDKV
jgi:hypothetical protein